MKVATQGEKKNILNFQRIIETDSFVNEVKRIREALNIPENGFRYNKGIDNIKIPKESEYQYLATADLKWETKDPYPREVTSLYKMFPLMNAYFSSLIRNYIYFNEFLYEELESYRGRDLDICRLMDAEEESSYFLLEDDRESSFSIESHNNTAMEVLDSHPISIRITADTGQNTLVDFIKKNWKEIAEYQEKYSQNKGGFSFKTSKTKINKAKKERADFIYKHKDLPRKEIMRLLTDKYGSDQTLDYGSIGKIISLENKSRKK